MSLKMGTPVSLPTHLKPFLPSGFQGPDQPLYIYTVAIDTSAKLSNVNFVPVKEERKVLTARVIQALKICFPDEYLLELPGQRFLMLRDHAHTVQFTATLSVFDAQDIPEEHRTKVQESESYFRAFHDKDERGKVKYRWTKLDAFSLGIPPPSKQARSETAGADKQSAEDTDHNEVNVNLTLSYEEKSLIDLVKQQMNASDPQSINAAQIIIDRIIQKTYAPETLNGSKAKPQDAIHIVHANKIFDVESKHIIGGLHYHLGVARTLRVAQDKVIVSEKPCGRLFIPACGLINFYNTFGDANQTSEPQLIRQQLCKALGQLRVKVLGSQHGLERRILRFTALGGSGLPQVDVGTDKQPHLVGLEKCIILPHQSFNGPMSISMSREISALTPHYNLDGKLCVHNALDATAAYPNMEVTDSMRQLSVDQTPISCIISRPVIQQCEDERAQPSAHIRRRPFKLCFAEISAGGINSKVWSEFKAILAARVKELGVGTATDASTVIRYRPDYPFAHAKQWLRNLKPLTEDLRSLEYDPDKRQQLVLVVALQDDEHQAAIYKGVKSACDAFGIQSYCVNIRNLSRQVMLIGTPRFAGVILHKIFARNPQETRKIHHLAIGVHITRVEDTDLGAMLSNINGEGIKDLYLVAMSSRAASKSVGYHNTVALQTVRNLSGFALGVFINDHVRSAFPKREARLSEITILRSGAAFPLDPALTAQDYQTSGIGAYTGIQDGLALSMPNSVYCAGSSPPTNGEFDHSAPFGSTAQTTAPSEVGQSPDNILPPKPKRSLLPFDKHQSISEEAQKSIIVKGSDAAKISYLHAEADRHFYLSPKVVQQGKSFTEGDAASQGQVAYIVQGINELTPTYNAVSIHREPGEHNVLKLCRLTLCRFSHRNIPTAYPEPSNGQPRMTSVSMAVNIPLPCGGSADTPRTVPRLDDTASAENPFLLREPSALSPSNFGTAACTPTSKRSFSLAAKMRGGRVVSGVNIETVPLKVADEKMIAQLFHDDYLDLHQTKWPVPTYLAMQLTKRALLHLEAEAWQAGEDPRPLELPKMSVNPRLDGTLYFL